MLYLFNSGFRSLYRANVLNTLYLPDNSFNEYRYSITEQDSHVEQIVSDNPKNFIGVDTIISFIDRYDPTGYRYYPLRKGKIIDIKKDNNRMHFKVELMDYIFPEDINEYNKQLLNLLSTKGLARLTKNDPTEIRDGYYVVNGDNIFQSVKMISGENVWPTIVNNLASLQAFAVSEESNVVFLRAKFLHNEKADISRKKFNGINHQQLFRKGDYTLEISYRYPPQLNNPNVITKIILNVDDPFVEDEENNILINSSSNTESLSLHVKDNPGVKFGKIKIKNEDGTLIPTAPIYVHVTDKWYNSPLIIVVILFYAFSLAFINMDYSGINNLPDLLNSFQLVTIVPSIVNALCVLALIKLFGSKIY